MGVCRGSSQDSAPEGGAQRASRSHGQPGEGLNFGDQAPGSLYARGSSSDVAKSPHDKSLQPGDAQIWTTELEALKIISVTVGESLMLSSRPVAK